MLTIVYWNFKSEISPEILAIDIGKYLKLKTNFLMTALFYIMFLYIFVDLYVHAYIRLHGLVLNYFGTRTILTLTISFV
jgi:hypothetical protein